MTRDSASYEAALRRGMAEFVATPPGTVSALPGLVERCRAARRRRRAAVLSTVGILAATAVACVVVVVHKPDSAVVTPAASASGMSDAPLPGLPLRPRTVDHSLQGGAPLEQPAHPLIGVSYPYNWFAHCGIAYISFAGRTWKVDHPVKVPAMHPDANGVTWGPPIVPGYVTLMSMRALRFDAPTYITGVELHVTTEQAPLCS